MEKTGTMYYRTLTADTAAQTGRVLGEAPAGVMLADSHKTYSVSEVIKRHLVDKSEVAQMGGIQAADELGARASVRSVMATIEAMHAAAVISAARYAAADSVTGGIVDAIIDAAKGIKRYSGKLAFVCSTSVYQWLVQQDEIKALLTRSFNGLSAEQAMSLSPAVFRAMLQGIFAFDTVLIGDDNYWEVTGREDAAAILKLPDPAEFSHKLDPMLGKTISYANDADQLFEIESFFDEALKVNCYDATEWLEIQTFNAAACVLVKGMGTATT
jgi:hypothetical protein